MTADAVVDATETEHRPPLLPSTVTALEAEGFRVLGRLALHSTSRGRDDHVYDRGERQRLAVWRGRPAATLLVASNGTSYATVDTFGDAPVVRLRTALADGSLVETVGVGHLGVLVPRTSRIDPLAGFTVGRARGRSVRLVPTVDPREVVSLHARHVEGVSRDRGSAVARQDDRDGAVRMWRAAANHSAACSVWHAGRVRRLFLVVWLGGSGVVLAVWFALMFVLRVQSTMLGLALVLALVVVLSPLIFLAVRAGTRDIEADEVSRPAYPVVGAG